MRENRSVLYYICTTNTFLQIDQKMTKKLLFITLFWMFIGLAFAVGQGTDSTLVKKLEEINAYMFSDPLAAKSALQKLLIDNKSASNTGKATICMKLATTFGMTNNLDSAFIYALESKRLAPDTSWEKASALKLIAILYRIKGDYRNAESVLKESLELNERHSREPILMAATLQEYGALCLDQHYNFKATTLFLKALNIVSKPELLEKGGRLTAVKLRGNLAEAYLASGNYPFAIREFSRTLSELTTFKDDEGLLRWGVQLADAYILNGNYESADSLLDRLTPIANKLQNDELRSYVLLQQGKSWAARGQFTKALPLYRNAFESLNANNSPALLECVNAYLISLSKAGNREEANRIMSMPNVKTAVANGQPADRLKYKKTAVGFLEKELSPAQISTYYRELQLLADSVNEEEKVHSASELQARYQFEKQQENEQLLTRENELLKQGADFKRKQLYLTIAIALLAIVILVMAIVRLRQRALLQSGKLKAKEHELEFQNERLEWMEREKSFRDQLMNQQRVLLTQAISDKEEMDSQLKELVKEKQEERRYELMEQLEKSKDKKLNIEVLLTEFNAIHPSFSSQLLKKYPRLSTADVQFCSLFRMNLTTKEISVLMNIEPQSIYKKKYRSMEKMGITDTDEFDRVLFGI